MFARPINQTFVDMAGKGDLAGIKSALEQSATLLNAKDARGSTALIAASANGHVDVVKFLLQQRSIELNAVSENGYTALLWAAFNNHTAISLALITAGANIGVQDKWGNTPLYLAVARNNETLYTQLLVRPGNIFVKHQDTQLTAAELAEIQGNSRLTSKIRTAEVLDIGRLQQEDLIRRADLAKCMRVLIP
jgi:ankyrin repeat protein